MSKISTFNITCDMICGMKDIMEIVKYFGFSDKESKIYLTSLRLGEASISQLAKESGVKRTTIYDLLNNLIKKGVLMTVKRGKQTIYIPTPPRHLLKLTRRNLDKIEDQIEKLEYHHYSKFKKPSIYFLYGSNGFKQVWDMVLSKNTKEYRIITDGHLFDGYISQQYLIEEIIDKKVKLKINSKQLITNSSLAKNIISRDFNELRKTKLLPFDTDVTYTTIITDSFVAFISPSEDNFLFVVESSSFAHSQKEMFEAMWDILE